MTYTSFLLAVVTLSMACITPVDTGSADCSTSDQGNAIRDLKTQFAALQTKCQVLQEEKSQQDVKMRRLEAVQSSTDAALRSLQQAQAKLVASTKTVAFMARKTDVQPVSHGTRITFKQSLANHGGYYSTSSSIFTCRDHSVYVFVATILSNNGSPTYFAIVQDGSPRGNGYTGYSHSHSSATEMAVITCRPGSRVWVMCHSNLVPNQKAWHHSYFGGFRV